MIRSRASDKSLTKTIWPWRPTMYALGMDESTIDYLDSLQWRHNGHDSVSSHQPDDCLPNRLFRRRSKKTSKLRVIGLCAGNSPRTGGFPAQMASNAENVSIWWRHHVMSSLEVHMSYIYTLCAIGRRILVFLMTWTTFPRSWPILWRPIWWIPQKGHVKRNWLFSLLLAWTNCSTSSEFKCHDAPVTLL